MAPLAFNSDVFRHLFPSTTAAPPFERFDAVETYGRVDLQVPGLIG
jgi:hypothetical protein